MSCLFSLWPYLMGYLSLKMLAGLAVICRKGGKVTEKGSLQWQVGDVIDCRGELIIFILKVAF